MSSANVYVPINAALLVVVEEIKDYLETRLLIQATQQEIIGNAIVALKTQLNELYIKKRGSETPTIF